MRLTGEHINQRKHNGASTPLFAKACLLSAPMQENRSYGSKQNSFRPSFASDTHRFRGGDSPRISCGCHPLPGHRGYPRGNRSNRGRRAEVRLDLYRRPSAQSQLEDQSHQSLAGARSRAKSGAGCQAFGKRETIMSSRASCAAGSLDAQPVYPIVSAGSLVGRGWSSHLGRVRLAMVCLGSALGKKTTETSATATTVENSFGGKWGESHCASWLGRRQNRAFPAAFCRSSCWFVKVHHRNTQRGVRSVFREPNGLPQCPAITYAYVLID